MQTIACASEFLQDADELKHEGRHAEAAPGVGGNPTIIVDEAPAQDPDRGAERSSAAGDDGARCCEGGEQVQDKGHGPGAAGQLQHRVLQACELQPDEGTPPEVLHGELGPSLQEGLSGIWQARKSPIQGGDRNGAFLRALDSPHDGGQPRLSLEVEKVRDMGAEPHGGRETPADPAVWSSGGTGQNVPAPEPQVTQRSKLQRSPRQSVGSSGADSRREDDSGGDVQSERPHHRAGNGAPCLKGDAQGPSLGGTQGYQGRQGHREPPQAAATAGLAGQAEPAEEHVSEASEDSWPPGEVWPLPFQTAKQLSKCYEQSMLSTLDELCPPKTVLWSWVAQVKGCCQLSVKGSLERARPVTCPVGTVEIWSLLWVVTISVGWLRT